MTQTPKNKKINTIGIILTVDVTLAFIWAAKQWLNRYNWPTPKTFKEMQANEIKTFKNLQLIVQAQEKYRQTDWDNDGKKNYAKFHTHLWTTLNAENDPVLINLIPKELAFAAGPYRAVDDYYFLNSHTRMKENSQILDLDYEKRWAIIAVPAAYTKKGIPIFIVDNSGRIFVQKYKTILYHYPHDPIADGWTEIQNVEQLKNFQENVRYSSERINYPYRYK